MQAKYKYVEKVVHYRWSGQNIHTVYFLKVSDRGTIAKDYREYFNEQLAKKLKDKQITQKYYESMLLS